ncbi:MAG: RimK family alpha-L-glutamate ligase [Thiotrichales bacterium]
MGERRTVLVSGYAGQAQTQHQIATLRRLGADVVVLTPYAGPAEYPVLVWHGHQIEYCGRPFDLAAIHAVLVSAQPPELPFSDWFEQAPDGRLDWADWFQRYGVQRDRSDALLSVLLTLEGLGTPMFNPPGRTLLSRRKPFQLQAMGRAGCSLPDTLVTSDPAAARRFIAAHGDVIVKPVAGGALTQSASALSALTLERVRDAPAIFQRRVWGWDVRVVTIDGRVVSSVIVEVPNDSIDFRGDPDYQAGRIAYRSVVLPPAIQAQCAAATRVLGLRFAGIDLKLTETGDYVFLECNSSPIYLDVERKLGHAITEQLCRALLEAATV